MAKGWPTMCKGIFYAAFGAARSESPGAGSRDTKHVKPAAKNQESAESRVRYPARNAETAKGRMIYK